MRSKIFLIISAIIFFECCTKDSPQRVFTKPAGCDSVAFTYDRDIKPIILANCSGTVCHSGGNANYDYTNYVVLANRIRSGSFEERLLLPDDDPLYMPPGRELGRCDLFVLRAWISQGYKK